MPGPWRPKFQLQSSVGPEALTEAQRHGGGGKAWLGAECIWEGSSSSHGPFFNHELLELLEFSRIGSGFAGDSSCRYYSCSLGLFVVQGHPGRMSATGGVWLSLRWRRECLSRSRRPCSSLLRCRTGIVAASLLSAESVHRRRMAHFCGEAAFVSSRRRLRRLSLGSCGTMTLQGFNPARRLILL
jgi:hypothetical protein